MTMFNSGLALFVQFKQVWTPLYSDKNNRTGINTAYNGMKWLNSLILDKYSATSGRLGTCVVHSPQNVI